MLRNYMEEIVDNQLPAIISKYKNICSCHICIEDIKAIALNQLQPLYVVTDKGASYLKTNELLNQFNISVMSELIKATEKVSNNPRHTR